MPKIVLAMSGGVDSSVAAAMLQRAGHEVTGLFMRHGVTSGENACSSPRDEADAAAVAEKLGIPFHVVSFESEFQKVVAYFVETYLAGRTPNPCAVCNAKIKFGKIVEFADTLGAEFIATGHYARIGVSELRMGVDAGKDQSYVLFGIRRELLPRLMFPVGEFRKAEIRQIAEEIGLSVAKKRDSQEICFVPDKDHAKFIEEYTACRQPAGEFITTDGKIVGSHEGLAKYTIGQRKGLGLAFGSPRYVVRLEPETNRVVLGMYEELAQSSLEAADANWLIPPPTEPFSCEVKIRYRTPAVAATVFPGEDGSTFRVEFASPIHGIAPGQAAVCYQGERLLGGGFILESVECGEWSDKKTTPLSTLG